MNRDQQSKPGRLVCIDQERLQAILDIFQAVNNLKMLAEIMREQVEEEEKRTPDNT